MTRDTATVLRTAGYDLFGDKSGDTKWNAQRNLEGRTHYVEDSTLRYFHSRIVSAKAVAGGALFYIIESSAMNAENTKRGFRFVLFDLEGCVIERPELEACFRTSEQARKALWAFLDGFDVAAHYHKVLKARAESLRKQAAAFEFGAVDLSGE